VSPATVANWVDQGHLKGHKTPTGRRRVLESDLIEFLGAHAMAIPPELAEGRGTDVVVVVDDDASYLSALVRTIEGSDLDVDVVEATSGVDGLLEIGRTQPALIVLDYALPDLNAYQVVERLLRPGRSLDAEVVVVTGGMRSDDAERLRRIGVQTIISKADGIEAVVEAMRQALRRRQAA
jgi:CheY-like chemotaxis protein